MRVSIEISGIVQGVGFRPTVYRYALDHDLTGFVLNSSQGVTIEIQGSPEKIESFTNQLKDSPPEAALIESFKVKSLNDQPEESDFIIKKSDVSLMNKSAGISPDLATCADCIDEIFDPENRRFAYAFTNCTNCGPRFTIIKDRPYDRPLTSMSDFPMCEQCRTEYENPLDRRFHAQPNACESCGPRLQLILQDGKIFRGDNPLEKTSQLLKKGKIAAVKGLGGFHFTCDPFNVTTVRRLRTVKNRPNKAFALMMRDMKEIKKYCFISESEEKALLSPAAPIVLLKKRNKALDSVSPDNNYLGIMLPFTPLHHLLLKETSLLIMTSANRRDEPLAINDEEVFLFKDEEIIDIILTHNRAIAHRCDDSIIQFLKDRLIFIRRSRGYIPQAITVKNESRITKLSLGANMKNTFSLRKGNKIYLSQHMGDLTDFRNSEFQKDQIQDFSKLLDIKTDEVHCDSHPGYENYKEDAIHIYHHHAHMLSVMAENNIERTSVLGVICDGTGFGPDNAIWGFEFLKISSSIGQFERLGHLKYFPLPGGEKAISEIDRIAIALTEDESKLTYTPERISMIKQLISSDFNSPMTSSLGRLFDGIAALTGLAETVEYEARGAILLQKEAESITEEPQERYATKISIENKMITICHNNLIHSVLEDIENSVERATIAWKFHKWIADSILSVLEQLHFEILVLSGGCFQNILLVKLVTDLLEKMKYKYYMNKLVPPNDGGISLGQAYYKE